MDKINASYTDGIFKVLLPQKGRAFQKPKDSIE